MGFQLGKFISPQSEGKPSSPVEGQQHFDLLRNELYCWNGNNWVAMNGEGDVAHDAVSNSAAGTGTLSFTHTPTAFKIRGVLVMVVTNGETGGASGATYGGRIMVRVSSRLVHSAGAEDGIIDVFFIGDNVPTGAQTVEVTVTGTNSKRAVCYSMTGPEDLTVQPLKTLDSAATKNSQVSVQRPQQEPTLHYAAVHSGQDAPESLVVTGTGVSDLTHDFGSQSAAFQHLKHPLTASSTTTIGWTASTEATAGVVGVSIRRAMNWGQIGIVPSAESSAQDDRFTYIEASQGIAWEFVCTNPGAEFPWAFIGGAPLSNEVAAEQNTTSETYVNLATEGPFITLPFKGQYDITIGAHFVNTTINSHSRMSYSIGATAASDADFIDTLAGNANFVLTYGTREMRKTIAAAATKLVAKYKIANVGEAKFINRYIKATPVRVA